MPGALTSSRGVLYVARPGARAFVRPYDFDGRALAAGFQVRGLDGGRADLRGLSVDEDRRLWAADAGARALRAFNVFGRELFLARDEPGRGEDRAGQFGQPCAIAASGVELEMRLLVASSGQRRHALHWIDPHEHSARSLRPMGEPGQVYRGLSAVAAAGALAYACESGAGRVQVFKDGEFHFAFGATPAPGLDERFDPRAIALLSGGRMLVCHVGASAALLLFDASGRFVRTLLESGRDEVELWEPSALAIEPGASDTSTRIAIVDLDGERVQVFALDGHCLGSFLHGPRVTV